MCVLMRFSHDFKLDNEHEWMIEFYHIGFSALIERKKKCSILKKRKSHALSVGVCRVWGALNAISYCEKVERDPARGNRVVNYINVLFFVTQDLLFYIQVVTVKFLIVLVQFISFFTISSSSLWLSLTTYAWWK